MYGEDVEYPDFRIRLPLFADDRTEREWIELVQEIGLRAVIEDGYCVYRNQTGQNYVGPGVLESWAPQLPAENCPRSSSLRL